MRTALLFLSLAICVPGTARAEMRIFSVDPVDPQPGWVVDLRGSGFGERANGRIVELFRIVNRQPVFYPTQIIRWREDLITVGIPRTVPAHDDYGIRVRLPGRMLASNPVRVAIRPPGPPARGVGGPMMLVAENRCGRRATTRVDGDTERWSGGLYAPCDNPPLVITDAPDSVAVGRVFDAVGDFGARQRDQVVALMSYGGGRLYVRHLLRIHRWTPRRIAWSAAESVESGEYALGILYRLGGPSSNPSFERGSNIVRLYVR
jgi:hypothetical protein